MRKREFFKGHFLLANTSKSTCPLLTLNEGLRTTIIMIETFEKVDSFLKILKFNIVISSSALKVDSSRRFPLKGSRN